MSIIYDALKRVEGKTEGDTKLNAGSPGRKNPKLSKAIFVVFFLIVLGSASLLVINISKKSAPHTSPVPGAPKIPPETPLRSKGGSGLSLSGVFFSDGEYVALINDRMVRVGDYIGEAQVVKIESDGVEIKFKDSTLRLSYP
ncbi:MAG: hypothetical protein ABIH40_02370 [Candidatus Omnitrophota bacterium]